MKKIHCFAIIGCLWLGLLMTARAGDNTNAPAAIGIYDSRVVAYAHFWSAPYQKDLQERVARARAAKQAGDTAKLKEYSAALRAEQDQAHRQVFSTAPVDDALAAIKEHIPEIEKQAGVSTLVSKWDGKTLQAFKDARRVDVTDQLMHQFFEPTEQQLKVIASIENQAPVPLEKCDELIRKGQL